MAKTKETTAESDPFTAAWEKVNAAAVKVAQAEAELHEAQKELEAAADQSKAGRYLLGLGASRNGGSTKAPTNGKRTRSPSGDKASITEGITEQLLNAGKGGLKSGDFDKGSHTTSTFDNVLRAMAKDGVIHKTGDKRATTYFHTSHKPKG